MHVSADRRWGIVLGGSPSKWAPSAQLRDARGALSAFVSCYSGTVDDEVRCIGNGR